MRDHTPHLPEIDLAGPLTVESVGAWRSETESFFAGQWNQLQSLIRRLEEEHWNGDAEENGFLAEPHSDAEDSVSTVEAGSSDDASPSEETARESSYGATNTTGACCGNGSLSDRLTELSRQLNQKLDTNRSTS